MNSDWHIVLIWTAQDDGSITGYRLLGRRPAPGEDGLLEYVRNIHSTAVTFTGTDVTPGMQHVYRVQVISAEDRSQCSNYVNVTRRTGDGSRQRERPRTGTAGPFETQKGCIKDHPGEEASMERFSPYLALLRPVPTGTSSGSCNDGY